MSHQAKRFAKDTTKKSKSAYLLGCSNKTRFRDRSRATEALVGIRYRAQAEGEPTKFPIRAYECLNCSGWHLSSREDRQATTFELAA